VKALQRSFYIIELTRSARQLWGCYQSVSIRTNSTVVDFRKSFQCTRWQGWSLVLRCKLDTSEIGRLEAPGILPVLLEYHTLSLRARRSPKGRKQVLLISAEIVHHRVVRVPQIHRDGSGLSTAWTQSCTFSCFSWLIVQYRVRPPQASDVHFIGQISWLDLLVVVTFTDVSTIFLSPAANGASLLCIGPDLQQVASIALLHALSSRNWWGEVAQPSKY